MRTPSGLHRRAVAALACALVLVPLTGCAEEPVLPSVRARLGPLLVQLAEVLERGNGMADSARYRVERGEDMREALALLRGTLDELRAAAAELALEAVDVNEPQAAAVSRQSVDLALAAADAADEEIRVLAPLVDADALMNRAVDGWRDGAQAVPGEELEELRAQLATAPVLPEPCRLLWDNRLRWLELVRRRGAQLAEADGAQYRDAFLADPFGEDRRSADAQDRECWRRQGALPRAMDDLRPLVQRFNELTRPPQ